MDKDNSTSIHKCQIFIFWMQANNVMLMEQRRGDSAMRAVQYVMFK